MELLVVALIILMSIVATLGEAHVHKVLLIALATLFVIARVFLVTTTQFLS